MSKLDPGKKKMIHLTAAVVLILLTYFLIYQRNIEQVEALNTENQKIKSNVAYLEGLQLRVSEMEPDSKAKEKEVEQFTSSFAPKITQEKSIYHIYKMMEDTGVNVVSVEVGNSFVFYNDGKVVTEEEQKKLENQSNATAETEEPTKANESEPEKKEIKHITGKTTSYLIGLSGRSEECMKALDWISKNEEKMAVGATSLAYDKSTGELSGTIVIHFFSMEGNGKKYVEPNLSGIPFSTKNIFGTKK